MSLNLTVDIDKHSGFCFGVVEAINKAEKELEDGVQLHCLGDIVHNDEEIKRLKKKGIRFISKEELAEIKDSTVLFRAHGEPPSVYELARKNNNVIVDASCPIIKKLQQRVKKSYDDNENIVIYGKPNHPEVVALNGQIENNGIIISNVDKIDLESIPEKITLYSQTTQSLDGFYRLVEVLKNGGKKVKVKDTICRRVSNRRKQLEKFCSEYDRVLFVAGKNSSNGKVLYDVCAKVNPNTYFISNAGEIDPEWFEPNNTVGVSGATSTPKWLMTEVKATLEQL